MDYLEILKEQFPVRRSSAQKERFRSFILEEAKRLGISARVEAAKGGHHNLLIGDVDRARVVITAHYDTPAAALIPNFMMPRNPFLGYLYGFGYPILLALLSLWAAAGIRDFYSLGNEVWLGMYLIFYFGAYYITTRAFENKHNVNDNTSGIATLLTLLSQAKSQDAAYILFDNEEKGLLGSKAFFAAHKELMQDKPVINLDCVGVGTHVLVIAKELAQQHPVYARLQASISGNDRYCVHFYPTKGSLSNSDYKSFPCGIGVMTCRKAKGIGYYTPYIHTHADTQASPENIAFLSCCLKNLIDG